MQLISTAKIDPALLVGLLEYYKATLINMMIMNNVRAQQQKDPRIIKPDFSGNVTTH
jgi:hypothetical protein